MTIRIQSDDGAIGKSITARRKKIEDTENTVCEVRVQMTVNRRQFEALAGFPDRFCDHFYTEEGEPRSRMSLLMTKRELLVSGTLKRGDEGFEAVLKVSKATASDMRFVPEPNTAVFICKLSWLAAGDEVEDIKNLLGSFCSVDLKFKVPAEQQNLPLAAGEVVDFPGRKGNGHSKDRQQELVAAGLQTVQEQLVGLGFDLPDDHEVWSKITPSELSGVMDYVEAAQAGKAPKIPKVLQPLYRGDSA